MTKRILFVCAGNICRSPMAEGMFRHLVEGGGLDGKYQIDSAATGAWHVGERPDDRMRQTAKNHGVELVGRARQVQPEDLDRFDLIVAMDRSNRANLLNLARREDQRRKVRLMREFDAQADGDLDVPDPYYGGEEGFEAVYRIIERACGRLMEELEGE